MQLSMEELRGSICRYDLYEHWTIKSHYGNNSELPEPKFISGLLKESNCWKFKKKCQVDRNILQTKQMQLPL